MFVSGVLRTLGCVCVGEGGVITKTREQWKDGREW